MPSAIDITKPIYGTPTTQSVRDNFHIARDEITDLQDLADSHVNRAGDTMTGPLLLYGDPYAQNEAATLRWVLQQLHSNINTLIYVGDYDGATDRIITSGQPQFVAGTALPTASPQNSQYYFTVKTGHASPGIGHQPVEGVTAGTFLLSNGVLWINYAMTAANITAKTTPIDAPPIPNIPGANVYDALDGIGQNFLLKSGGTLTGLLTLNGPPSSALHASTKKYVDDSISVLTFPSEAPQDGFGYARASGAWTKTPQFDRTIFNSNTGAHISLTSNAGTDNHILGYKGGITRWGIHLGDSTTGIGFGISRHDDSGTTLDSGNGYVLAIDRLGGAVTLSRNLILDPPVSTTGSIFGRGTNNPTNPANDTLNIWARTGGGGATIGLRGPTFTPNANAIQLYAGASSNFTWNFFGNGTLTTPGHLLVPTNFYIGWDNPATSWIHRDTSGNFLFYGNIDWRMYWAASSGNWYWQGPPNYGNKMVLGGDASLTVISTIVSQNGRIMAQGGANSNPSFTCWDTAQGFAAGMFLGGGQRLYFSAMDGAGGFTTLYGSFSTAKDFYCEHSIYAAYQLFCYGAGVQYTNICINAFNFNWANSYIYGRVDNAVELAISNTASDERMKVNVAESTFDCLDMVMKTPLFQYRFRDYGDNLETFFTAASNEDTPVVPVGFIAQQQYKIFPDSVLKGDDEIGTGPEGSTRIWSMNTTVLCATLFGAIKQLVARIEALESNSPIRSRLQ